ncbi:hypothetical protein, partial [Bradyrhizobium sp.]|uniref:hypothetical protein n=1 Tax=Bradyrhizobium sp. TaxID=376 RepID=UPI003C7E8E38
RYGLLPIVKSRGWNESAVAAASENTSQTQPQVKGGTFYDDSLCHDHFSKRTQGARGGFADVAVASGHHEFQPLDLAQLCL